MRTRDETCSLGAPILIEEAKAAGVKPTRRNRRDRNPGVRQAASDGWVERRVDPVP